MTRSTATAVAAPVAAPYSSLVRRTVGVCLVLAGVTNGLSQYLSHLLVPDLDGVERVRWGLDHPVLHAAEPTTLAVSALFLPLGLLGIAQVTRWSAPRLTLVGTVLAIWGTWGFHNILASDYLAAVAAPSLLGEPAAVTLNEEMYAHPGLWVLGLVPHLLGSLGGGLLLTIAAWRSGCFPRAACAAVVAFLVWDFFLPPVGPLEAHLLLFVGWAWMGVALVRMPQAWWHGGSPSRPRRAGTRGGLPDSGAY